LDIFNAPPLIITRSKFIYASLVSIRWTTAFIIAAAIPDYFGFVGVISASMLLNLTYILSSFFALGFDIQKNALQAEQGEGFDPTTGQVTRNGTTVKQWVRGFFGGGPFQVAINIWYVICFFASLSMCGLGMYAAVKGKYPNPCDYENLTSIIGMIAAFRNPELNLFSCRSPLNLTTQ
jgi:hypothetical protein